MESSTGDWCIDRIAPVIVVKYTTVFIMNSHIEEQCHLAHWCFFKVIFGQQLLLIHSQHFVVESAHYQSVLCQQVYSADVRKMMNFHPVALSSEEM